LQLWIYSFARKRWRKVTMNGQVPTAAVSHCLFKRGQYLLCYGGSGKSFGLSSSNTLSRFDLATNTWSVVSVTGQPPLEMYGQGGVINGNLLYVVGGTTGHTYSNEVHVLDLTTRVWTQLSSNYSDPGPEPRYRHEIAFYDDKLWTFGGGTAEDTFELR
jgi:N-acetylneuraminic acid mutarotase